MKDDHSESLAHFQQLVDEERKQTNEKHALEIAALNAELERIKTELTGKIEEILALVAAHTSAMENLKSEKDALIADAETRLKDTEEKLGGELAELKSALAETQTKLMVTMLHNELTVRILRQLQMQMQRNTERNWRCVPRDLGLPKV